MHTLLLTLLVLAANDAPAADCWLGFRGDGSSQTMAKHLPLRWSSTENVSWKASLPGYGQSSPVIWKDRVFVTAVHGPMKEKCLVLAFTLHTGKLLWKKEFLASQQTKAHPTVSRAAPTPVVDERGLYVLFESGDLIGLSQDGAVKWQRSLVRDYGAIQSRHGLAGSLAQTGNAIIVLVEHNGPSYLLAVDKASGANLWKTERQSRGSWTTPLVMHHHGHTYVLVSSGGSVCGYHPATGKELCRYDGLFGNNIPSPAVAGNLIVVGASESLFRPDRAGSIRSNCCLRLTTTQDSAACELAWPGKKAISQHASPLIHQDLVYFVTKLGLVHCLDLKTGDEKYVERLDDTCWATPIAAQDRIYFFGKDGATTVLKAGPKFHKLASNRLWSEEEAQAKRRADASKPENQSPKRADGREQRAQEALGEVVYGVAAVDNAFVVRTGTGLYCIRE